MVLPLWPPITGTLVALTSRPLSSATNALARRMSRVETPFTPQHTSTHTYVMCRRIGYVWMSLHSYLHIFCASSTGAQEG